MTNAHVIVDELAKAQREKAHKQATKLVTIALHHLTRAEVLYGESGDAVAATMARIYHEQLRKDLPQ